MTRSSVPIRFVGMLSSPRAEAVAREWMRALEARCGGISRWEVRVQPPLVSCPDAGYAVRAQARLVDGSVLAIRAHGRELLTALGEAFGTLGDLLAQESLAA